MPMPGNRGKNMGKPKQKINKGTLKRLIKLITNNHKKTLIFVVICIILSSVAGVLGSVFIRTLIDKYITPLIGSNNPDFSPLLRALTVMATVYLIGTLSNFAYNRKMILVSQGVLKNIRNEMFSKMQNLPIK